MFAVLAEPKQHISHSTVEKQRRDRINSLIDEVHVIALQQGSALDLVTGCPPMQLRDLVPPSAANNAQQDGFDNKRPKHVVLSDTIALVKELQDKVCCQISFHPVPVLLPVQAQYTTSCQLTLVACAKILVTH